LSKIARKTSQIPLLLAFLLMECWKSRNHQFGCEDKINGSASYLTRKAEKKMPS
jgi:hypothetical protein